MKKNGQKSLKRTGYSSAKPPVDDESGDAGPLKAFGVPCPVISETGVRIVHFLIGKPPQTITAMMKALNVARAAITHELNNLVDIGYVDRALEKNTGRGRPRYLFSVTKKAMRDLFESSQDILCPAVWKAIQNQVGTETLESIRREVADRLAEFYERQLAGKTPQGRLREMLDLLWRQGRLAEMKEYEDSTAVHILSCPFANMVEETGSICRIHLLYVQRLCGDDMKVSLVSHRAQEGRHCCVFLFQKNERKDEYPNQGAGI